MKIADRLPQFTETKTLIIVADHYRCTWYEAYQGTMNTLDNIELEKTTYSDREGFSRGPSGTTFETSAIIDKRDQEALAAMFNSFEAKHATLAAADTKAVYIFAPQNMVGRLEKIVTSEAVPVIITCGIFTKEQPSDILERIQTKLAG